MHTFLRYWLPVVLWAVLIGLFSTSEFQPASTYRLLRALVRFFSPQVSEATLHMVNAVVRKAAHVSEYLVLSLLVWRALRRGAAEGWRRNWALGTLGLGVLCATGDELHQLFERGRGGSVADVGYDSLGIVLALLLLYARVQFRSPHPPSAPASIPPRSRDPA